MLQRTWPLLFSCLLLGCGGGGATDAGGPTDAGGDLDADAGTPMEDSGPTDPCPDCVRSALYPDAWTPEDTAPEDWTELVDAGDTLWPRSLYEDQRARRLGGK